MSHKLVLGETALVGESLVASREVTDVRALACVQVDMLQHVAVLSKFLPALLALESDLEVD